MRVTLSEINELSKDWSVAKDQIQRQLQQLTSAINIGWNQEHNSDGSHGDVVADSLDLQGGAVGEVVDLPFDAARYKVYGAGVWTVTAANQISLRYIRCGQIVVVQFMIADSVLSGTDAVDDIVIQLPELHALPSANGNTIFCCGTFQAFMTAVTLATATSRPQVANEGVVGNVLTYFADFGSSVPSTGIAMEPYSTQTRQWSLGTGFTIHGFAVFFLNQNNAANPFKGT